MLRPLHATPHNLHDSVVVSLSLSPLFEGKRTGGFCCLLIYWSSLASLDSPVHRRAAARLNPFWRARQSIGFLRTVSSVCYLPMKEKKRKHCLLFLKKSNCFRSYQSCRRPATARHLAIIGRMARPGRGMVHRSRGQFGVGGESSRSTERRPQSRRFNRTMGRSRRQEFIRQHHTGNYLTSSLRIRPCYVT